MKATKLYGYFSVKEETFNRFLDISEDWNVTSTQLVDLMLKGAAVVPLIRRGVNNAVRDLDRPRFAKLVKSFKRRNCDLAAAVDVCDDTVVRWKRCAKIPSIGNFLAVCKLLKANPVDFIKRGGGK